jgi:hypothetical protein
VKSARFRRHGVDPRTVAHFRTHLTSPSTLRIHFTMAAMTVACSALSSKASLRAPLRRTASVRASKAAVATKASMDEAMPAPETPPPKPSMKEAVMNTMSFGGWAPELINGRVAQIAFVAGLGAELSTGQSFTEQFAAHTGSIVFASGLITLASFMPNMQATDEYTANPASLGKSNGPWTTSAEMTNGRGAMVGLVAMLLVEKAIGGPLTGIFSGADSDELFASTFYDDSFATQVEAPAPAPAKFADFDSTVVAPAPVAAEATLAYEDAVAAEPIRVEGAADAEVEAEAVAFGRAVSEQEEAAADVAM